MYIKFVVLCTRLKKDLMQMIYHEMYENLFFFTHSKRLYVYSLFLYMNLQTVPFTANVSFVLPCFSTLYKCYKKRVWFYSPIYEPKIIVNIYCIETILYVLFGLAPVPNLIEMAQAISSSFSCNIRWQVGSKILPSISKDHYWQELSSQHSNQARSKLASSHKLHEQRGC